MSDLDAARSARALSSPTIGEPSEITTPAPVGPNTDGRARAQRLLEWGLLGLLLVLWAYECGVLLQAELRFTADSERDAFHTFGLAHYGILPTDGIRMAALGIDLGPLYFLLTAPINLLWPSPQGLYCFNLLVCSLGLVAFWRFLRQEAGLAAAFLGCLFYTQSSAHVAMIDTIWHVGAIPGVVLAMIAVMGRWSRSGELAALLIGGVLLTVLVQLHALGAAYGPAALFLLWLGRQHLNARRLTLLLGTCLLAATPLLVYAIGSAGDSAEGAARHAGGMAFDPAGAWLGLRSFLQPRYLFGATYGGWLVLLALVMALFTSVQQLRAGGASRVRLYLIAQLMIGFVVVSIVIPYEGVGRYFMPLFYPVFALAALGFGDLDKALAARGRHGRGRAWTWAVLLGCLAVVQPPLAGGIWREGQTAEPLDYLTAQEQEAVVRYLVEERGLKYSGMRGRVHGAFFGPLTGIRYVETTLRDDERPPEAGEDHWFVQPHGLPDPPLLAIATERVTLQAGLRPITLHRFPARFDPGAVRTADGVPCPWPFPYLWTQTPPSLLKTLGFPAGLGPDIHRCLEGHRTLVIPVAPHARRLTLQLTDEAQFSEGELVGGGEGGSPVVSAHIEAEDAPPLPLALQPRAGAEKLWFSIPVPAHDGTRELHLTLRPRGVLGFIDLF